MSLKDKTTKPLVCIDKDNQGQKSKKARKIVDADLADIVMETRSEIEDWQHRYKKLRYNLALTNKRVTLELSECEARFSRQYRELEKQRESDIVDLHDRFEALSVQKSLQGGQNSAALGKMEGNHLHEVEALQREYDTKLELQMSEYLRLEQEKLELRKDKERQIAEMTAENEKSIGKLLEEFKENLNKVQTEFEESQKSTQVMKGDYDVKVGDMTVQHDAEVEELRMRHREAKEELDKAWKKLDSMQQKEKENRQEKEREKKIEFERKEKAEEDLRRVEMELENEKQHIKLLQNEQADNNDKLHKREKDLYKYRFKIKDLKKSKHVLTHRTTEMKASLQPKEDQINDGKRKVDELGGQLERVEEWMRARLRASTVVPFH